MPIKVMALDHVTITVTDLERAKRFYGQLLGLEEVPRPMSFDFPGAWLRAPNALIHLIGSVAAAPESPAHFALWVDDIHEAAELLQNTGCEIIWEPRKIPGIDRFFSQDPDGNRIEFQGADGTVWNA